MNNPISESRFRVMSITLYTLRIIPVFDQTYNSPIFSNSGKTEELLKQLRVVVELWTTVADPTRTLDFNAYLFCQYI